MLDPASYHFWRMYWGLMLRLIVLVSALAVASTLAAAPVRLTEEAIRQSLVGSLLEIDTPLGVAVPVRISADGLVSGEAGALASTLGAAHDRGRWWIDHDQLCVKWFRWFEAQPHCLTLQREGQKIYWQDADGKSGTATITASNPQVATIDSKPASETGPSAPVDNPMAVSQPSAGLTPAPEQLLQAAPLASRSSHPPMRRYPPTEPSPAPASPQNTAPPTDAMTVEKPASECKGLAEKPCRNKKAEAERASMAARKVEARRKAEANRKAAEQRKAEAVALHRLTEERKAREARIAARLIKERQAEEAAKRMPLTPSLKPVDQRRRRISPINLSAPSSAAAPLGSTLSRSSAHWSRTY